MSESPTGTDETTTDEEEQRRLGWEIFYVGNLARELAERKAREGKTPPPYRPKRAKRDARGNEPAGKDESCSEEENSGPAWAGIDSPDARLGAELVDRAQARPRRQNEKS